MPQQHSNHTHGFNTALNPELHRLRGEQNRISFTGVTFRNFALKANINRLQMFCDNYLNFVDDDVDCTGHYFKAAAPYVTLAILNYGRMATESENLGWIAQHEVLFSVPVEWYRVDAAGNLVFHDWAYVCPFIFVDNDQSLGVGREVYGWSKVRAWLQPGVNAWTNDPRKPRRLLRLATELFPKLYEGNNQESRVLIEIVQEAPPSFFRSPFSIDDPYDPWWSVSRNLRRSASAAYGAMQFASGIPLFGYDGARNIDDLARMYGRLMEGMRGVMPTLGPRHDTLENVKNRRPGNPASPCMNNLTLKQFRDAQNPDTACYQALVNSRISIENLTDGGLLGGPNLMLGDITGGYQIHIHDYPEQPIVQTLGIEVGETVHDEAGVEVSVVSPLLPNWMACDLRYDMGTTLAWRAGDSVWTSNPNTRPPTRPDKRPNHYNTARGAAMQDSVGPFHYPDTTMRVFPLIADQSQLQAFCDEHLNKLNIVTASECLTEDVDAETVTRKAADADTRDSCEDTIEAWGSHVFMVVTSYGDEIGKMYTEQNNLGQTVRREVAFWIPVKWRARNTRTGKETLRVAFLTPYVFCDSMRHALSESEVNGRPVMHSRIDSNDDSWLRESGPAADHKLLTRLRTLLMPAMNVGQPAEIRDLIEITEGDVAGYNEDIPWAAIKANWKPVLQEDYCRKVREKYFWMNQEMADGPCSGGQSDARKGKAPASWEEVKGVFTGLINNNEPINFLTLKQYRSTSEINTHCYQAVVLIRKRIKTLWDLREMPRKMHVGIHEYATLPIIKQLGLKIKTVDSRKHAVVPQIEPVRPFFIRASMVEEVGTNIYTRYRGQPWESGDTPISAPDARTQTTLDAVEEPSAIIESVLWDSWAGHDRSNPYSGWDETIRQKRSQKEEAREFVDRDQNCKEFFMRPDNFGMTAVNQQVYKANTRTR